MQIGLRIQSQGDLLLHMGADGVQPAANYLRLQSAAVSVMLKQRRFVCYAWTRVYSTFNFPSVIVNK